MQPDQHAEWLREGIEGSEHLQRLAREERNAGDAAIHGEVAQALRTALQHYEEHPRYSVDRLRALVPHEIRCACGRGSVFEASEHDEDCPRREVDAVLDALTQQEVGDGLGAGLETRSSHQARGVRGNPDLSADSVTTSKGGGATCNDMQNLQVEAREALDLFKDHGDYEAPIFALERLLDGLAGGGAGSGPASEYPDLDLDAILEGAARLRACKTDSEAISLLVGHPVRVVHQPDSQYEELVVPGCVKCGLPTSDCTCKGNLGWRGKVRIAVLEVIDETPGHHLKPQVGEGNGR